jgi:hypothetical protein
MVTVDAKKCGNVRSRTFRPKRQIVPVETTRGLPQLRIEGLPVRIAISGESERLVYSGDRACQVRPQSSINRQLGACRLSAIRTGKTFNP